MEKNLERVGDAGFAGVNMRWDPAKLEPGVLSHARNVRLSDGEVVTRRGCVTPPHAKVSGVSEWLGSGVYSDPDGLEWLVLAGASKVYFCRHGEAQRSINLPIGVALSGACEPVQAFEQVVLFRGTYADALEWSGAWGTQFAAIPPSESGSYLSPIPRAATGEVVSNRMLVPDGRDVVAVSDILDYTRYDATFNSLRINYGSDDRLVRIRGWFNNQVVMFKEQSIYVVSGFTGDLTGMTLDLVQDEVGLAGRRAVVSAGGDLLFLSNPGGIYRMSQILENRLAATAAPISEAIEPLINRIHWPAASGAVAAALGEYVYFAVPLDGASANNAILVYNARRDRWEGYDTYPAGVSIDNLLVTDYHGRKALYAVNHAAGRVLVLDYGLDDEVAGSRTPVSWEVRTRSYGVDLRDQEAVGWYAALAGWNPRYSVARLTDGVEETTPLLSAKTRERTRFMLHGKGVFNPSAANADHDARGREDYSLLAAATPDGFYLGSGVEMEREQEYTEAGRVRGWGRNQVLKISGDRGRVRVRTAGLELRPGRQDRKSLS